MKGCIVTCYEQCIHKTKKKKSAREDTRLFFFFFKHISMCSVFRQQWKLLLKLEGNTGVLLISEWATGSPAANSFSIKGWLDVQFSV